MRRTLFNRWDSYFSIAWNAFSPLTPLATHFPKATASSNDLLNPLAVIGAGTCVASPTNATRPLIRLSGIYSLIGIPVKPRFLRAYKVVDNQGSGHIAFASWMSSLIVSSGISGPFREWCTTLFFTHPKRYNKSLFVLSYHAQPSRRLPLPAAPSLLSTIEPNKNP